MFKFLDSSRFRRFRQCINKLSYCTVKLYHMCIGPLKSFNVFKILSILKFQVYYFVIIRVLYYNFLCKSTDFFNFKSMQSHLGLWYLISLYAISMCYMSYSFFKLNCIGIVI